LRPRKSALKEAFSIAQEGCNEFVAQIDPRSKVTQGDSVELVIDTSQPHFFDPESGLNIMDRHN
jgi:ABC-type sugar transport system ATPase subunit